jgi:hypothetical protein
MVEKEKRMNQIFNRRKETEHKFSLMRGKNVLQHKKVAKECLLGGEKGKK